jgi:transcriptional regulator with XRE-family HTH domain
MTIKRSKGSLVSKQEAKETAALEALMGGPLTLGMALESLRRGEDVSQSEFARKLGLSSQKLCDIEKGRRHVSPERAAQFARKLGHPIEVFVRLALQDQVNDGGLKLKVSVESHRT